jgi:hypothetical protein
MARPCSENGRRKINPLNVELNPICHLLVLLAHHIFHVSRVRVNQNSIELDAETKEGTRITKEKLDGKYKEGHELKKPKRRRMRR